MEVLLIIRVLLLVGIVVTVVPTNDEPKENKQEQQ
jgi:hypothetical protein